MKRSAFIIVDDCVKCHKVKLLYYVHYYQQVLHNEFTYALENASTGVPVLDK